MFYLFKMQVESEISYLVHLIMVWGLTFLVLFIVESKSKTTKSEYKAND